MTPRAMGREAVLDFIAGFVLVVGLVFIWVYS